MPKSTGSFRTRSADLASYSFTEPVVRVRKDKIKEEPKSNCINKSSQKRATTRRMIVFHKRKDRVNDVDVIGTRDLSTWRKSSGRSKSWRAYKRFMLTWDYLELLMSSKGHPTSFGWRFSTANMPISFVRGQGLYVNKKSKSRKDRVRSGISTVKDLDEEYNPDWGAAWRRSSQRLA